MKSKIKNFINHRYSQIVLAVLAAVILLALWLWCSIAIYFSNLPWAWLRGLCSWGFIFAFPALIIIFRKKYWYALLGMFGACLLVIIWFFLTPASHDRNWETSVVVLPYADVDGDKVTIHNIRNFDYRTETDFTPRYYDRVVDLNKLKSVDYVLSYWDGNVDIAHTIISYGFEDGFHMCVSVETRREKGEPQTGLRGLFHQYELIYILADERDVLRLRTDFRKEEVYVYPIRCSSEELRLLFMKTISRVNEIYKKPEFYNTITENCLTTVLRDFWKIRNQGKNHFDKRMILNGHSAEMAYEKGNILTDFSYEETKKKCHANQYLSGDYDVDDYSKIIRHRLNKE